jgi:hypothetical protein
MIATLKSLIPSDFDQIIVKIRRPNPIIYYHSYSTFIRGLTGRGVEFSSNTIAYGIHTIHTASSCESTPSVHVALPDGQYWLDLHTAYFLLPSITV